MKKTIIFGMMMMLMAGMVLGASTFKSPLGGATISGAEVANVTVASSDWYGNATTNCSIIGSSTKTGDTLSVTILYNHSSDGVVYVNNTIETTDLIDANDWTFSGTCYNASYDVGTSATIGASTITPITGVIVDNSAPICSQSTLASSTSYDADETLTVTVTATNATGCRVAFDSNLYQIAEGSDTCSFDLTQIPDGIYNSVIFYTNDGTDETACTALTDVQIKSPRPRGGLFAIGAIGGTAGADKVNALAAAKGIGDFEFTSQQKKTAGIVLIILIIGLIVWLDSKKKK